MLVSVGCSGILAWQSGYESTGMSESAVTKSGRIKKKRDVV